MDVFDFSLPTDGSVSSVGTGTDVSAEAGGLAPAGALIVSYLQEHGYSLRTLVAMSHGCKKEGDAVMLGINAEPFALMPSKAVKAFASNYCNKVTWRYSHAHEENDPVPCPKQWSILKCQEWLDCHPIEDGGGVVRH